MSFVLHVFGHKPKYWTKFDQMMALDEALWEVFTVHPAGITHLGILFVLA